jgi:hypothetical protein
VYRFTDLTQATLHYRTRGLRFDTTTLRRHKITVSAIDYGTPGGTNVPKHLIQFDMLTGQPHAGSNGVLYVTLRDNMTNYVTPKLPPQFTNYTYSISAERHLIHLNFRNTGQLTGPDTNGVGYYYERYNGLARWMSTQLGPHDSPDGGVPAHTDLEMANLMEFSAIVGTNDLLGWLWHQDIARGRFLWVPGSTTVTNYDPKSFSSVGPQSGNDDNHINGAQDVLPDDQGSIFLPDAPTLTLNYHLLQNAPTNSIAALRFYARTWLTFDDVFVSEIVKWRTFITIKKTPGGWVRVGPNNFIELTPGNTNEIPAFDVIEASGL